MSSEGLRGTEKDIHPDPSGKERLRVPSEFKEGAIRTIWNLKGRVCHFFQVDFRNLWYISGGYHGELCGINDTPQAIILKITEVDGIFQNFMDDVLRVPAGYNVHFQPIYLGSSRGIIMKDTNNLHVTEDGLLLGGSVFSKR